MRVFAASFSRSAETTSRRGPLDELLVRELALGAVDLALDARDLLPEAFDLPAPQLLR